MTLEELVSRLGGVVAAGDLSEAVGGIIHDSRRVRPGWIFAAFPGATAHGLTYLEEARKRGAAAVLTDRAAPEGETLPWLVSAAPRRDAAVAAWALAGDPQRDLTMVGVTGTNGKSTVVHLLWEILQADGRVTGLFGTLAYRVPGVEMVAGRTTPEAADLAPLLARLVASGGEAAVMEVSSHAIALERVAGLEFDVAVLTNLSQDHLDFHHDMESYFATKRWLFTDGLAPNGHRVLPLDEPAGERLLAEERQGDVTYGLAGGEIHAVDPRFGLDGSGFRLSVAGKLGEVHLPLIGEHNLRNALAAAAAAHALGVPTGPILQALCAARPLPGRLERVATELPFPVYVDYAHTPDGLAAMLRSLRRITKRRLLVVFGAGGDRDPGKRIPMGRAVGGLADVAIVTSDNPRSEEPEAIAAAVASGVRAAGAEPRVVLDRREAIAMALGMADDRSLVVIAGKGHEAEQVIGGRRLPFCDREVVSELAGRLA